LELLIGGYPIPILIIYPTVLTSINMGDDCPLYDAR